MLCRHEDGRRRVAVLFRGVVVGILFVGRVMEWRLNWMEPIVSVRVFFDLVNCLCIVMKMSRVFAEVLKKLLILMEKKR